MEATTSIIHKVTADASDKAYLVLNVDGQEYRILWENCSSILSSASPSQRENVEVAPSGYGLHWPLLDEDLAVKPLLKLAEK